MTPCDGSRRVRLHGDLIHEPWEAKGDPDWLGVQTGKRVSGEAGVKCRGLVSPLCAMGSHRPIDQPLQPADLCVVDKLTS